MSRSAFDVGRNSEQRPPAFGMPSPVSTGRQVPEKSRCPVIQPRANEIEAQRLNGGRVKRQVCGVFHKPYMRSPLLQQETVCHIGLWRDAEDRVVPRFTFQDSKLDYVVEHRRVAEVQLPELINNSISAICNTQFMRSLHTQFISANKKCQCFPKSPKPVKKTHGADEEMNWMSAVFQAPRKLRPGKLGPIMFKQLTAYGKAKVHEFVVTVQKFQYVEEHTSQNTLAIKDRGDESHKIPQRLDFSVSY